MTTASIALSAITVPVSPTRPVCGCLMAAWDRRSALESQMYFSRTPSSSERLRARFGPQ